MTQFPELAMELPNDSSVQMCTTLKHLSKVLIK